MIKILSFLFLFSLINNFCVAQTPTQAEIDQMIKKAQIEMEKMKKDPKLKEYMKNMPNMDSIMKNMPQANNTANNNNISEANRTLQVQQKNKTLFASIPKNTFTTAELVAYCNTLFKQLSSKIDPGKVKSVADVLAIPGGNAYKFNLAAVASWYNGALEESVLMAVKAVTLDPGYDVALNNAGAILNMGGLEYKAIPILKVLVQKYPDNAMVLNNMGQAYAGLGENDSAMYYLARCIAKSPNNPEANNTAGQIELTKGNKGKAKTYFENSIKGAFSESSSNALRYLDPKVIYSKYIRPQVHIPEYFNAHKYRLPPQCENVSQAADSKEAHHAFKEMIHAATIKYGNMEREETKIAKETVTKKLMIGVNQNHESMPPFFNLAYTMLAEINNEMTPEIVALDKFNKHFDEDVKNLEIKYEQDLKSALAQYGERSQKVGEGNGDPELDIAICKTREKVANEYLLLFSNLRKNWQQKNIAFEKKYIDERIFWSYLLAVDIHAFRSAFYSIVTGYLTTMNKRCETKIIKPCNGNDADKHKLDSLQIKEPDCPIDIEIRFIVGKYSLNCTSVSFSGGEGFVFKYSKNFSTRQSTMSLGIGAQLELGGGFGGVHIGAEAGLSESVFVKFDGSNHVTAAGLKFDADASAGAKASAGDVIKVKKDLLSVETGVGYTVGIESGSNGFEPGIHFNEGPLQKLLNPAEEQINKKVPIYK